MPFARELFIITSVIHISLGVSMNGYAEICNAIDLELIKTYQIHYLKGKLSDSFTNYNYVGNTKVSVYIKKT